jgi:hypothetical protein
MVARYSFAWLPAAIAVATVVILASPYLALIVLAGILFATIAAIGVVVWEIAVTTYRLPRQLILARRSSSGAMAEVPLASLEHASMGQPELSLARVEADRRRETR